MKILSKNSSIEKVSNYSAKLNEYLALLILIYQINFISDLVLYKA